MALVLEGHKHTECTLIPIQHLADYVQMIGIKVESDPAQGWKCTKLYSQPAYMYDLDTDQYHAKYLATTAQAIWKQTSNFPVERQDLGHRNTKGGRDAKCISF